MAAMQVPNFTAMAISHIGKYFQRKGRKFVHKAAHRALTAPVNYLTDKGATFLQKAAQKGSKGLLNHLIPVPERTSISREEAHENRLLPVRPYRANDTYRDKSYYGANPDRSWRGHQANPNQNRKRRDKPSHLVKRYKRRHEFRD